MGSGWPDGPAPLHVTGLGGLKLAQVDRPRRDVYLGVTTAPR